MNENKLGVFFRKFTKEKAVELQLAGWVKNTGKLDLQLMNTKINLRTLF